MAKQHGPILLTGQLGGISFYEMNGKYYARLKTAHSAERIRTDPKFEKTYRNGLDFGTASRASKLLRTALGHTVKSFADPRIAGRMTARFVKVVRTDSIHEHGKRRVSSGDLSLLKGFEFNKHASFGAYGISPTIWIDRAKNLVKITVSNPRIVMSSLVAGIVCVNFKKGTYTNRTVSLDDNQTEFTLRALRHKDPHAVVIVTLGLAHSSHDQPNSMAIVDVHQPPTSTLVDKRIKRSFPVTNRKSTHNNRYSQHRVPSIFPRAREKHIQQTYPLRAPCI